MISKEFFDIDWDYTETYFWKNMYHKKEIENVEKVEEENDIIRCEFESRAILLDRKTRNSVSREITHNSVEKSRNIDKRG